MCSTRKVPGTFEGEWQIYQPHNVPRRGGRINTRNVVSAISEVPLVLWESGYLMMRWLEHKAMTSRIFRSLAFCSSSHIVRKLACLQPMIGMQGGSRVLELGAGIGLAAITATLAGAKVVATDGSSDAP